MISCPDQDRSAVQEPQKGWYQVAVVLAYEVCGAVAGGRDLEQQSGRERLVFEVSVPAMRVTSRTFKLLV